jgi:hypothetical protein
MFRFGIYMMILNLALTAQSTAQGSSFDERRPYIARDLCVGIGAKFGNAPEGGEISFEAGQFRVQQGRGVITIFEGSTKLTEIPGFNYKSYTECLDVLLARFERVTKPQDATKPLEAFMAGYELGDVLNVGMCMRSAAMGGYYIGDIQDRGRPLQQGQLEKLTESVSKSVVRHVKRFSGQDITLDLLTDLKHYRFFADRSAPYFDPEDVQSIRDSVNDVTSSNDADYFNMGFVVGRMKRVFLHMTALTGMLESIKGRFDERAMRANQLFPASLQCLRRVYLDDQGRLRQIADDLGLARRFNIPDVDVAFENGRMLTMTTVNGQDTGVDNSKSVQYFDERVTARIRQSLRNSR